MSLFGPANRVAAVPAGVHQNLASCRRSSAYAVILNLPFDKPQDSAAVSRYSVVKHFNRQSFSLFLLVSASGIFAAGSLFVTREQFQPFAIGCLAAIFLSLLLSAIDRSRSRQPQDLVAQGEKLAQHGRKLAIFDPIHGVLAHWYFELRLEEEVRRSRRYEQPMAILTMRRTSDALGSADRGAEPALTDSLVRIAIANARTTDLVGMLDFNSLAICLTETDHLGAFSLLKRMMTELGEVDCQVGIAISPQDEGDGAELVRLAEKRSAPWRKPSDGRATAA